MPPPKPPETRQDLVAIIAGAIRRHATWLRASQADAMADTVLGDLKAAGVRILRGRPAARPPRRE